MPFKVIDGHRGRYNRKPVCDFLLMNTNGHPIPYRFEVTADHCSNFGYFSLLSHPMLWGVRGNVQCLLESSLLVVDCVK